MASVGDQVSFTFPVGGVWRAYAKGEITRTGKRVSIRVDEVEDAVGTIKVIKPGYIIEKG